MASAFSRLLAKYSSRSTDLRVRNLFATLRSGCGAAVCRRLNTGAICPMKFQKEPANSTIPSTGFPYDVASDVGFRRVRQTSPNECLTPMRPCPNFQSISRTLQYNHFDIKFTCQLVRSLARPRSRRCRRRLAPGLGVSEDRGWMQGKKSLLSWSDSTVPLPGVCQGRGSYRWLLPE